MIRPFATFVGSLRYLFMLAVLALSVMAAVSLFGGLVELVRSASAAGLKVNPGSLTGVVSRFVQAAFLYFLAAALCSLFVTDLPVPQWMSVRNLLQLRTKILTFVSIILPLAFLGRLMDAGQPAPAVLYTGAGVFLVLAGIFLLIRFGSPSGDDGMAKEGTRIQYVKQHGEKPPPAGSKKEPSPARASTDKARRTDRARPREKRDDRDGWTEDQKEKLKFQKESLEKAVENEIPGESRGRPGSNVTVRPGPRKPRGRR